MTAKLDYRWHLREVMATRGMFSTTDLRPLLAERGIDLSASQVYRMVVERPERLSLKVLMALMDILGCRAYLKLATGLEDFLTQLRGHADTATVPEQQRVLRLLVKDVLIGPERILIRHCIPANRSATPTTATTDRDADEEPAPGSRLRWRSQDSSNAMGNFCFEVSLGYRRLERLPRVTGGG